MKIVIAPDSFKESLNACQVADLIEQGFKEVIPNCRTLKYPMSDGGEGTIEAVVHAIGGSIIKTTATDPLGKTIPSFFGLSRDGTTAIIEMAAASGLPLVKPDLRDPMRTTSFGTGELIKQALDKKVRQIIIGIGGSATNEGGAGLLQALGVKLLDRQGKEIGFGGRSLAQLASIDISRIDARLKSCRIQVACDVSNPLTGENGASAVFGPQKGATPEMIKELDKNLLHFATLIKKELKQDILTLPGGGAAGGVGATLKAFLNTEMLPGVDMIAELYQLKDVIKTSDLVITGEGKMDDQTAFGKTPAGVAKIAHELRVPVIGISGSLSGNYQILKNHGFSALFAIVNNVCDLESALKNAETNLLNTSKNIADVIKLTKEL